MLGLVLLGSSLPMVSRATETQAQQARPCLDYWQRGTADPCAAPPPVRSTKTLPAAAQALSPTLNLAPAPMPSVPTVSQSLAMIRQMLQNISATTALSQLPPASPGH